MIEALLHAAAFPHPVGRIELLETHISWVVLTGDFAYKIKKPVSLGFLDFRMLERRRHYCEEEFRLNRTWAPGLYLDVVPIVEIGGEVKVGGKGTPIEYAVLMRQFDQVRRLDHQIETGCLVADDVLELSEEIAERHLDARRLEPSLELEAATRRLIWDNFVELDGVLPDVFLEQLRRWMQGQLDMHAEFIRWRCENGYFRECHGDLHLRNIVRLPEGIRAFDCIEFSRELREIDIVADYAFLTMDFIARGSTGFAYVFVNRYLEKTGDYDGVRLLPVYLVYRSMVRAKVAEIGRGQHLARTDNAEDTQTIGRYCALARALTSRRRPTLVLMTGLSGSGKTWLSTRLISALPALRLRSDLERKRLFEMEEAAASGSGIATGIYERNASAAVYERLLLAAEGMLCAGINVILDAAFLDIEDRSRARRLARSHGTRFVIVNTVAARETLLERLRQRRSRAEASEADAEVLMYQIDTADALDPEEMAATLTVNTEGDIDIVEVARRIRQFRQYS